VQLLQEDVNVIPLHRQVIPWVSRANISVVHRPSNLLVPMWVKVQ
jgi:peptide/nickel transport system substrate-binding protein